MNKSASARLNKERGGSLSALHFNNKKVFLYSKTRLCFNARCSVLGRCEVTYAASFYICGFKIEDLQEGGTGVFRSQQGNLHANIISGDV